MANTFVLAEFPLSFQLRHQRRQTNTTGRHKSWHALGISWQLAMDSFSCTQGKRTTCSKISSRKPIHSYDWLITPIVLTFKCFTRDVQLKLGSLSFTSRQKGTWCGNWTQCCAWHLRVWTGKKTYTLTQRKGRGHRPPSCDAITWCCYVTM